MAGGSSDWSLRALAASPVRGAVSAVSASLGAAVMPSVPAGARTNTSNKQHQSTRTGEGDKNGVAAKR